jgi:hypothetical protein
MRFVTRRNTLRTLGCHQAIITAEAGSLEAEAYVVVSSGTSLPVGSTVWSVDPLPGYQLTTSVGVHDAGSIAFARVETAYDGPVVVDTVVRGMDLAGQQVTIVTVPLAADETVSGAMGDNGSTGARTFEISLISPTQIALVYRRTWVSPRLHAS